MRGENLQRVEAGRLLGALLDGEATDAQIAAALVALAVKGETVEELAGMAAAMRERADSNRVAPRNLHRYSGQRIERGQNFQCFNLSRFCNCRRRTAGCKTR